MCGVTLFVARFQKYKFKNRLALILLYFLFTAVLLRDSIEL